MQQAAGVPLKLAVGGGDPNGFVAAAAPGQSQAAFYFAPLSTSVAVSLSTATTSGVVTQPIKFQTTAHAEVSQVSTVQLGSPKTLSMVSWKIQYNFANSDLYLSINVSVVGGF